MNEQIDKTRRHLFIGTGIGLLSLPAWGAGRLLTPRQTAGPFYPDLPLPDKDSDLTHIPGIAGIAAGEITDLSGQVLDAGGNPLDSVRIEIWQCDANGRYRHSGDNQAIPMDPNFQGFGHTLTDQKGRYRFRTIRPVSYPGRTPHIHAAVFRQGMRPFVTQIYIADDPRNAEDFLFQRIPVELRPLAVADFIPSNKNGATFSASFDFVLI
ncbi:MAG: intradiol ring-cleavage dioxygenase [Candidatus Thiodiazotropha sp. (ex Semelilucina semeliformis)]|nr:intradiol ring-cleavage dioxygenase [Candidatus Thiodiazotropha sp. (ex Semelilucina semeliformis)]